MSIETLLIVVGLVLFLIAEFQAQGRSLVGWGGVFVSIALLWGRLG